MSENDDDRFSIVLVIGLIALAAIGLICTTISEAVKPGCSEPSRIEIRGEVNTAK